MHPVIGTMQLVDRRGNEVQAHFVLLVSMQESLGTKLMQHWVLITAINGTTTSVHDKLKQSDNFCYILPSLAKEEW